MPITIRRARRVVDLVTDLSLLEQHTVALRALELVRQEPQLVATEAGPPAELVEAAAAVQKIEAEIAASTLYFTLEAIDRLQWAAHVAAHPPRGDNDVDEQLGVDVSSLDMLMPHLIKAVHDHAGNEIGFDPLVEWGPVSAQLSDGQWADFANALVLVNRGTAAPKSKAASLAIQSSSRS